MMLAELTPGMARSFGSNWSKNAPMFAGRGYDASGKLIESGEGVVAADYPASLTSYVKTKYKDEKIVKVYKIKDANGKTVWKGKVKQDYLYFDENGNYIKMEKD